MVKVKDDSAWMSSKGIDPERWLIHLEKKETNLDLSLIRHALNLSQVAANHPTETSVSCLQQGLAMADLLVDLSVDSDTIAAALVFDCVLYADLTLEDVEEQLGPTCAKLIKGVKQMGVLSAFHIDRQYGKNKHQIDNIRKMLLAMVDDVRVVLIKLAERLCVLRQMEHLPDTLRRQTATEVMDVFAPLANRLGIGAFKWEMEDLVLKYLEPKVYSKIAKGLKATRLHRDHYVENIVKVLSKALVAHHIKNATIYGRSKHINSIYKKMLRKNLSLSDIHDVTAIRVLVNTAEECYMVLSVAHALWQPIAAEFDDYISQPKLNGYQSLHTAVIGPEDCIFEIQIRTYHMHELAEKGVAAHWKYKEGIASGKSTHERKIEWLREVLAWHKEMTRASEIPEVLEHEFLDDHIYVFTPEGDVLDMPYGSTPLDFAYYVHSQLGHRCRGAKVNNNIVPLTYVLQTGDRVEVLASKEEKPSRDWINPHLHYLFTSRAKAKVLHWFKMQDYSTHVENGQALLEKELKSLGLKSERLHEVIAQYNYKTSDDFYAALGRGDIKLSQIIHRLVPSESLQPPSAAPIIKSVEKPTQSGSHLQIEGVHNLLTNMARCCQPVPGDSVIGYVTIGRGVSIHRKDCQNVIHASDKQRQRFLQVGWSEVNLNKYLIDLYVKAFDRVDILKDITAILAIEKAHIYALRTESLKRDNLIFLYLTVEINSLDALSKLITKLLQVPNVLEARRQGALPLG